MATMNVSLPDKMKEWVEERVKSGLYANASDVVRDLIRSEMSLGWTDEELVALAKASLDSGDPKPIDKGRIMSRPNSGVPSAAE